MEENSIKERYEAWIRENTSYKRGAYNICLKCEGPIDSAEDSKTVRTVEGVMYSMNGRDYLCPGCYKGFSELDFTETSFRIAMRDFHEKCISYKGIIPDVFRGVCFSPNNYPDHILHEGRVWGECNACDSIVKAVVSKLS